MCWSLDQWRRSIGGWSGGSSLDDRDDGRREGGGNDPASRVLLWFCYLVWLVIFSAALALAGRVIWSFFLQWITTINYLCSIWWVIAVIQQCGGGRMKCIVILLFFLVRYALADDLDSGQSDDAMPSFSMVASTVAGAAASVLKSITNRQSKSSCGGECSSQCCSHKPQSASSTNTKQPSSSSNKKKRTSTSSSSSKKKKRTSTSSSNKKKRNSSTSSTSSSGGGSGSTKRKRVFTTESYNAFYAKLQAKAEKIPSEQSDHTRIAVILDCPKMKQLISLIFILISSDPDSSIRRECTLEKIAEMFRSVDVDIDDFRDDIDSKFENESLSKFLKMMLVYTFRKKQGACACCGRKVEDFLYGAIGFESNHWDADKVTNGDTVEGSKCFGLDAANFYRCLEDILNEFVKTRLECWVCHNRYGPYLNDELPDECYGVYNFDLLPFCDVQKLPECIDLAKVVKLLLSGDVLSYRFGYVKDMIESGTIFDVRDVALFNEERWNNARSTERRKEMLMRLYLQGEKRMSGGCYMCCEPFDNRPLREFGGLHGHHLQEDKKDMNPSEGAQWSVVSKVIDRLRGRGLNLSWFGAARREHKKTFPLCCKCHMKVTYDEDANDEFLDMVDVGGYTIDDETGIIRSVFNWFITGFQSLDDDAE